jgi:hypothetical protein
MTTNHRWKFFRSGGLDQVLLQSGEDLLNLHTLDQKLWVALSCPVKGLELDEKTLALLDTDKDGRIRVPEILAAIKWLSLHLKTLDEIVAPSPALPLSALNDQTPEGQAALASAKQILANLGRPIDTTIALADTSDTKKIFANTKFNGDGVVPADAADDADTQQLIADILATLGGEADRSGKPGITQAKVDQFYGELSGFVAWTTQGATPAVLVAGDATAAAYDAVKAVRAKVDDYFARTRLAAYDSRALSALNRQESEFLAIAAKDLKITSEEVSNFPLSRIEPGKALPLLANVNPAWSDALAALYKNAVTPLLGAGKTSLTPEDWTALTGKVAAYEGWLAAKAGAAVASLGLPRAQAILAGPGKAALAALIAKDLALAPQAESIATVDRLVRLHRDFGTLLRNFVNFSDFYDPRFPAIFQTGTLYLDSRSCDLCIRVDAPSPLVAMSKVYVAYIACTRPGSAPMNVAACITQGDSDYLFVGRHGLFYDRQGRDWDAVVTSIVDNPISVRQAFWSPYKKFIRMIEEQVAKRAAAAEAESTGKLASVAEKTANADKAKAAADSSKKVDIGAVAAIGVVISGLISALTLILGYVFQLKAWQYPLVLVGILLVISGPSMVIAWLKLRQRTLGPILDANGWAVNGRVKVNIPLGTSLTDQAVIPAGSTRLLNDPFEDKAAKRRKRLTIFLVLLLLGAWLGYNLWAAPHYNLEKRLWPFEKKAEPVIPVVTPEVAAAAAATPAPAPAK